MRFILIFHSLYFKICQLIFLWSALAVLAVGIE